jgi:hypothetical protein
MGDFYFRNGFAETEIICSREFKAYLIFSKIQKVKLGPKSTFPLRHDGGKAACTWMVKFRMTPFTAVTIIEVFKSKKLKDQAYTEKNVLLKF